MQEILLVERAQIWAFVASKYLEHTEYSTIMVASKNEALIQCAERKPALILCEYASLDGDITFEDFEKMLAHHTCSMPLIVLSETHVQQETMPMLQHGAYIQKPVYASQIYSIIRSIVDG